MNPLLQQTSALANDNRLAVMGWLKDPCRHFRPQIHADLERDGVCGVLIAQKLGVSPATASAHMKILVEAGLVRALRLGKFTYFKRVDEALTVLSQRLAEL